MSDIGAFIKKLLTNPQSAASLIPSQLATMARDPKTMAALNGLVKRIAQPVINTSKAAHSKPNIIGTDSASKSATALVGVLSLLAVTGAVVAVATVSTVAMRDSKKKQ